MTPNVCCPECGFEITKALAQARAEALEEMRELLLDCQSVLSYVEFYGFYPEGSLGFADVKSCLTKLDRALQTNEGG